MKKSMTSVIKQYFGLHPGQKLIEFRDELKELTADDKKELAVLAARDLGLTQDQVDFPLT